MGENSNIEWCHHTFNPWRGCTKVSDGCKFCYADTLSHRNPRALGVWGPKGTRPIASESYWKQPEKWDKEAAAAGERRRVFCASLADVFEGPETMPKEAWPQVEAARERLFELIEASPHLDWLLLTKRPENVIRLMSSHDNPDTPGYNWQGFPDNVWIGTSCEDQKTADERIPHLLNIPAKVRFLSCEPLLGPVDLSNLNGLPHYEPLFARMKEVIPEMKQSDSPVAIRIDCLQGRGIQEYADEFATSGIEVLGINISMPSMEVETGSIDWVICGGESGPNARPMHPDWARSLRDQCQAAGVAFHFKQWGEWEVATDENGRRNGYSGYLMPSTGEKFTWLGADGRTANPSATELTDAHAMAKVGKKAAGRELDGRTWDEFPGGPS